MAAVRKPDHAHPRIRDRLQIPFQYDAIHAPRRLFARRVQYRQRHEALGGRLPDEIRRLAGALQQKAVHRTLTKDI